MYKLAIKNSLDKKLKKLQRKDKEVLQLINRKVQDILTDPYRFKPLKKPLQNKRRVLMLAGLLCWSMELTKKKR